MKNKSLKSIAGTYVVQKYIKKAKKEREKEMEKSTYEQYQNYTIKELLERIKYLEEEVYG